MGLGIDAVEAIYREHSHRPIDGDVLLMGRQTVYFSPQGLLDLMKQHGHESHLSLDEITIDKETISRKTGMPTDIDYVSDISIFQMLGARSVRALDHSDYEGAEVVHDLTKPLPDKLKGIADFIVDGSTLDNTFSAALTIRNYAELLRPGGRILMVNMWSPIRCSRHSGIWIISQSINSLTARSMFFCLLLMLLILPLLPMPSVSILIAF